MFYTSKLILYIIKTNHRLFVAFLHGLLVVLVLLWRPAPLPVIGVFIMTSLDFHWTFTEFITISLDLSVEIAPGRGKF